MGELAFWGAQRVAKTMFGQTASPPATWYMALITGDEPSGFITGAELAEPVGGAYARQAIANTSGNWQEVNFGYMSHTAEIWFPIATANWGRVHSWALCDALTNGNIFSFGRFNAAKNIETGDRFYCGPGSLGIEFLVGI